MTSRETTPEIIGERAKIAAWLRDEAQGIRDWPTHPIVYDWDQWREGKAQTYELIAEWVEAGRYAEPTT